MMMSLDLFGSKTIKLLLLIFNVRKLIIQQNKMIFQHKDYFLT